MPVPGLCQRKLGCEGQGGEIALPNDKAILFSLLQDVSRDHPLGGNDVHPVPVVATERRGFAARARYRY